MTDAKLNMDLINAFTALYEALKPLTADQRYRLVRALCVLLDVPIEGRGGND